MTAIKNGTLLVKDSNGNTARVATLSQTDITTLNTALTGIEANSVSIQSLTNQVKTIQGRYVDVDTPQTITGLKHFTQPPYTKNLSVDFVENQVTFGNAIVANLDKYGRYISGVSSGMYVNSSDITDKTTILQIICAASTADSNGIIAEFQKKHKDGVKVGYAPSTITHNNLAEIATTDWCLKETVLNGVWAYKFNNRFVITLAGLTTLANQLKTRTFPIPYIGVPIMFANTVGFLQGDQRNYKPTITNGTNTSVSLACLLDGIYVESGMYFVAFGAVN